MNQSSPIDENVLMDIIQEDPAISSDKMRTPIGSISAIKDENLRCLVAERNQTLKELREFSELEKNSYEEIIMKKEVECVETKNNWNSHQNLPEIVSDILENLSHSSDKPLPGIDKASMHNATRQVLILG